MDTTRIAEICAALNADPRMDLTSPTSAGHDWAATVEAIPEYNPVGHTRLRDYGSPAFLLSDGTVILHDGRGWHEVTDARGKPALRMPV